MAIFSVSYVIELKNRFSRVAQRFSKNIDQIKKAMESIAGDQSLRKSLGQKAIGVKSDFSWKIAAQKTIELYRELT